MRKLHPTKILLYFVAIFVIFISGWVIGNGYDWFMPEKGQPDGAETVVDSTTSEMEPKEAVNDNTGESEIKSTPEPMDIQRIEAGYDGGRLMLVVETNQTEYRYDEYVYVTATLINRSNEVVHFYMPTSTRGVHQELQTEIRSESHEMLDVDMYLSSFAEDSGMFSLEPLEEYVQNMRFSVRIFNNQEAEYVYKQETGVSGVYTGTVTAYVLEGDQTIAFPVSFQIVIGKKEFY